MGERVRWWQVTVRCSMVAALAISAMHLRPEIAKTWRSVETERNYLSRDSRVSLSSLAGVDANGRRAGRKRCANGGRIQRGAYGMSHRTAPNPFALEASSTMLRHRILEVRQN